MRSRTEHAVESAAMQGIVPDAILGRRERTGFPVSVREWLGELAPWVGTNIAEISCLPFLEPRAVRQTWDNVRSKRKSTPEAGVAMDFLGGLDPFVRRQPGLITEPRQSKLEQLQDRASRFGNLGQRAQEALVGD